MKVYNADKTQELTEYDLEKGYLKPDKLLIGTVPEQAEERTEEVIEYPNGGKEIIPTIVTPYRAAYDEYEDIQVYIPYTAQEIAQRRISELKPLLTAEDYKIIKCMEAQLTGATMPYDYEDLIEQREEYRAEINSLEGKE